MIHCRDAASPLGKRLTAVVWQLPAFFKKNIERLEKFLQTLRHWETTRHTIEFRHKTWFDDEVADCLTKTQSRSVCPTLRIGRCGIGSRQISFTSVYTGTPANTHRTIANPLSKNGQRARSAGFRKTGTCTSTSTMTPKARRRRMH